MVLIEIKVPDIGDVHTNQCFDIRGRATLTGLPYLGAAWRRHGSPAPADLDTDICHSVAAHLLEAS